MSPKKKLELKKVTIEKGEERWEERGGWVDEELGFDRCRLIIFANLTGQIASFRDIVDSDIHVVPWLWL